MVPQARDEGGEGDSTNDTNCTRRKQRNMKRRQRKSPFVSELGAALLGWSRGYLGFPPHTGGGRNRWRGLIVNVIFLDNLGLGFIEHPVTKMVSAKQHREWKEAYTSCSMIQLSRLDASCSRRAYVGCLHADQGCYLVCIGGVLSRRGQLHNRHRALDHLKHSERNLLCRARYYRRRSCDREFDWDSRMHSSR